MNYQQAMEYISNLELNKGSVLGLEPIRNLLKRLGNPQDELSVIHIAGTNGKGSTQAFLLGVLKEAGYQVGSYISPTIFQYRERIQIGGTYISEEEISALFTRIVPIVEEMKANGEGSPTAFEIETVISFLYFKEKKVDFVLLETGLGGREDATNVVLKPICSVITNVSMDHMGILGNTLEEIAREKAGIIKEGCPIILGINEERVVKVVSQVAKEKQAPLYFVKKELLTLKQSGITKQTLSYKEYEEIDISLGGNYQIDNAATALEVLSYLKTRYPITEPNIRAGMSKTKWQGRFEVIKERPLVIRDGAHNEAAARALEESIKEHFTNKKITYIMGMLRDKEFEKV
ncbi:MAG: folylpolyglutamate synthase/dihydrofolate synthase family protein, partial [Lachnospiraceae bacterium]|nr:folylpolyglutamate synthase/dihydrofolate synthase family protein [Lachnospiraceae bacterium]